MSQKRVTLTITEEIINASIQRDSSHCMIAEAVYAQIPGAAFVSVDLQTIRWTDRKKGRRYIAFTPAVAQQALVDFDRGDPVKPFTIRATVVQTLRVRARDESPDKRKITERAPSQEHKSVHVEGGQAPPTAALSNRRGRRRTYGLRSLDR